MSTKYRSISLALTLVTAMLPTVFAWSPAFYDKGGCGDGDDFSYAVYSGSGSTESSCQVIGDPGNNCEFFTDSGYDSGPCTAPFKNPVLSVGLPAGTKCFFFTDMNCQDSASSRTGIECVNVARQSIVSPVSFKCVDV